MPDRSRKSPWSSGSGPPTVWQSPCLPAEVVLVEFVRFNVFDFTTVPGQGEAPWRDARYLAFVLPARAADHVQMIDLGEAESIDRMIAAFRASITGETESRGGRDLGALPVEPATDSCASTGATLRAALFDPLVAVLGGSRRLVLAPDGDLARLPFEVLPMDDGRRLIDAYAFSYVSAGRDVLRFAAVPLRQPTSPIVLADPDFDLVGNTRASQQQPSRFAAPSPPRPRRGFLVTSLETTG